MKPEQISISYFSEYRKYLLLTVAALALFFSGIVAPESIEMPVSETLLITWGCVSGVFIVYRFNDYANRNQSPWKNAKEFFKNRANLIVVLQFFLIGIPLCAVYISLFQFFILALAGITGIFYAVNFKLGSFTWMAKYMIGLKNALIGLVWALMFVVGYGTFSNEISQSLFLFIVLQVFIGSSIRDLFDLESDKAKGLNTIPTVVGLKITLVILHVINISSLSIGFFTEELSVIFFLPVVIWRMINLVMIQTRGLDIRWTQVLNLLTCVVILIALIFFGNGRY